MEENQIKKADDLVISADSSSTSSWLSGNQIKKVDDLVRQLHHSLGNPALCNSEKQDWGHAVFLIGAGCSHSAGIPLAPEIAKSCVSKLVTRYSKGKETIDDPDEAINWLFSKGHIDKSWNPNKPNWGELYGKIFEEHFRSDIDQKERIIEAINKSKNKINWAHICLGELVKQRYVHTVLTTNFDQLVLRGIINTGLIPVIADGVESLTRIDSKPQMPQVVHIHGSMHTYSLRNSITAVKELKNKLPVEGMMYGLLKDSKLLVVVGYSGGEEAVMDLIIQSSTHFNNMVVYWAMFGEDFDSLSDKTKRLLRTGNNKFIIPNCDADAFFAEIMEGLEIGAPEWMEDPTKSLLEQSQKFAPTDNNDIQTKSEKYQGKIIKLSEYWKAENAQKDIKDEIATLRLEGDFEEALTKLEEMEEKTYEVLRLKAETSFEAGQKSLNKEHLEKSVNYWQQALETITKEDSPDQWSDLQFGLGKSLQLMFEVESSKDSILHAVNAYKEALKIEEFKNDRRKLIQAYNNLGVALLSLYDFEENSKYIEEAISAHKSALEIINREETPKNWAETQSNLAGALQTFGDVTNKSEMLEEAINTFNLALSEYTKDKFPDDWAETQNNLAGVYQKLGEIKDDPAILNRAVQAYNEALKIYTSETDENRAWVLNGLGSILKLIGEKQESISDLEAAINAYSKALEFFTGAQNSEMVGAIQEVLEQIKEKISILVNNRDIK